MGNILNAWINDLHPQQQIILLMSIRHCDNVNTFDPSKIIINEIRKVIFRIEPISDINIAQLDKDNEDRDFRKTGIRLCNDHHNYPINFYKKLLHSAAIIGYKHPEIKTRKRWFDLYVRMAEVLHLHIETEEDIDNRLR